MATNDPARATPPPPDTEPAAAEAERPAGEREAPEATAAAAASATGATKAAASEAPAAEEAPPSLETLQRELDQMREEAQRYLGIAQRAQADFLNYRRRAEQEKLEAFDNGRAALLKQLAPVLDDLDRALGNVPPEGPTAEWVEGLQLIRRKLLSALEAAGIERIAPEGQPFDPLEHEAVLQVPREDVEPHTVVSVVRAGYRLGGRVVMPAQVVVATAP
ncbi:MAG TPA: nucleotide exchange factor GrpE [Chloroflexota bacterium]|nr:nucleotide exchange factor GrpE [Chloroflexota bacterium]